MEMAYIVALVLNHYLNVRDLFVKRRLHMNNKKASARTDAFQVFQQIPLVIKEAAQYFLTAWMTQFAQSFSLDLTNTLTGYVKLFTNFFQCMVSVHIDTKTHTQNFRFTCS